MLKHSGINTFSFYQELTAKQKSDIIEQLKVLPKFDVVVSDDRSKTYIYRSDYLADEGVRIWVKRKKGKSWGLIIVVHPMLVLDNLDRSPLYSPLRKSEYQVIVETVDEFLMWRNIPCSVDEMQLYRVDTTIELTFTEDTSLDEHMRILKKSVLLPHHKLDFFRAKEYRAKDCKRASKHSYTQYCKSAVFLAYDRAAQSEMIDAFPNVKIGKRTLRLEVQLRRDGMKKWVGKNGVGKDNWKILQKLGINSENTILWYIDRLQPVEADYERYSDTVDMIGHIQNEGTHKRMLYLVQRINKGESITTALEKLKEEYHLSKGQCKAVLNTFYDLDINPITLKDSSNNDKFPSLDSIIRYFFQ